MSVYVAVSSAAVKMQDGKVRRKEKDAGWGKQDSRGWGEQYHTGWGNGFSPGEACSSQER